MTNKNTFELGRPVMTANFKAKAEEAHGLDGAADRIAAILKRHGSADWGELSDQDKRSNDLALKDGDRLLSSYETEFGFKVWVITEADRSYTTIMLPEDY